MRSFEERILAYLDGSLNSSDRAELLHILSVSPEKRAILEGHLRLREILASGHKPLDVPISVERSMAKRIPVLSPDYAHENEEVLDYAASSSRFGLLANFMRYVGMVLSPVPIRVVTASLLIAAGLWVTIGQRSLRVSAVNFGSNTTQSTHKQPNQVPQLANVSTPSTVRPASAVDLRHAAKHTLLAEGVAPVLASFTPNAESDENANQASNDLVGNATQKITNIISLVEPPKNDQPLKSRSIVNTVTSSKSQSVDVDHQSVEDPTTEIARKSEEHTDTPTTLAAIADGKSARGADRTSSSTATTSVASLRPEAIRLFGEDDVTGEESTPGKFSFTCYYGLSKDFSPVLSTGNTVSNALRSLGSISLDYRLASSFWLGVEGGQNFFSRIGTTTTVSLVTSEVAMYHVNYNSQIQSVGVPWLRATMHYAFWSQDRWALKADFGAGASFLTGPAPLVAAGSTIRYTVDDHMGITLGARYTAAWLLAEPLADWRTLVPNDRSAVGIIKDGAANRTLFTPVVDVLFGLQYQL
jgi:hypothetical protein